MRLGDVFFEEFFCVFFGDFADAFVFVDADHRRLFAHALAIHLFNQDRILKARFLDKVFEAILDLAIVFAAFFSVAQQNHLLLFVFLSHVDSLILIVFPFRFTSGQSIANVFYNSYLF